MTKPVNIREICLEILQEITEEEAYSHIVLREVLEKYQYLEKRDRAFISRVVEGTLEHMIQMGLSSKERQQGIYFAESLSEIREFVGE